MIEVKVARLTCASSSFAASCRSSFNGKLEGGFHEPIREIGGGGREVLLQNARDALPFGRLKGRRQSLDAHLQTAGGLHRHKTALQVHLARLHPAQNGFGGLLRHERLVSGLQQIRADHPPVELNVPGLQTVGGRPCRPHEVGHLLALEARALGIGGKKNAEGLQTGVINLVLKIGDDLDLGVADGGVLEAGDLNPRIDPFDVQGQAPGHLQYPKGQHSLLADAGTLRVQLCHPFRSPRLQTESLLRGQQQRAALLAGLPQRQSRDLPGVGPLDPRSRQADSQLLLALGLARQVQRNHPPRLRSRLRPMAQRRPADRLDIEARRHDKTQPENARPRDVHSRVVRQDRPVFAQRKGILRLDTDIGLDRRGLQLNQQQARASGPSSGGLALRRPAGSPAPHT